jgi:hypothetical protein
MIKRRARTDGVFFAEASVEMRDESFEDEDGGDDTLTARIRKAVSHYGTTGKKRRVQRATHDQERSAQQQRRQRSQHLQIPPPPNSIPSSSTRRSSVGRSVLDPPGAHLVRDRTFLDSPGFDKGEGPDGGDLVPGSKRRREKLARNLSPSRETQSSPSLS